MSLYSNVAPLSTFLSTATAGAPATTALAMVQALTPKSFTFTSDTNNTPHYLSGIPADVQTLAGSQAKYDACLYPQPPNAIAISTGDMDGLVAQAVKDLAALLPTKLQATTNGSGVATVALTGFAATPSAVQLTATTVAGDAVIASVTTLSNTSLTILTQTSAAPATPIASLVYITVYP